ncbi:nuclease-related domain-containing protein [Streptomyces sp. NPDC088348]|uniref:nuclease-related domain-containing protein n=1 Tax=Streptomyces sp. NPDC088348 TaxID=3365853 RepID=UPI0038285759
MSVARNSAAARAAAIRAGARLGGGGPEVRRAASEAARWEHGAAGEEATVRLLRPLHRWGWLRRLLGRPVWVVRHDLRLHGRHFNVDHLLVSPCGTGLVVLDTKNWRRGRGGETKLVGGRVCCGTDDRHGQIEKVAEYARLVEVAVGVPGVSVQPLVVVHGSRIPGGHLTAPVPGGSVLVVGTDWLVPTLAAAVRGRDPRRAAALAARVDQVLHPYINH